MGISNKEQGTDEVKNFIITGWIGFRDFTPCR